MKLKDFALWILSLPEDKQQKAIWYIEINYPKSTDDLTVVAYDGVGEIVVEDAF